MGHFITGLVDEILTPFNEDGSINYEKTKEMINWHLSVGVKAFFVNGLAAECQALTNEEKINLLKSIYEETKGKAKLMVCSFENSIVQNKELLDLYEETGMADCYCITAPPFFRHTQEALYDYTSQLIKHVDKPVYIYNCVQMGALYAPDTLAKLVENHPNLRGFKDASVDILNFIQCTLRIDKDNYDSSDDIKIVGNKIIDIKNQYAVKNKETIDKVVEYATEALKDKNNIFIYDYSSTVEKIVSKLDKGKNIYIAESRIIDGGKPFLKASLEAGLNVHYFPDASIMYFLGKSDVALMGAETFYPDGTGFNTTGSDIVGLVCAYFDIPLYFATPLIKVDSRPLYGKKKNIVFNNVKNKLSANFSDDIDVSKIDFVSPELLGVSPKYIKAFITEKGVIPSSAMYEVSIEYLKEIGGNKI